MVCRETLVSHFVNLGCVFQDEGVIQKCLELCESYGIDEESFVELWVSYSVPHYIEFEPSVENLIQMEKSKLSEKGKKWIQQYVANTKMTKQTYDLSVQDVEELLGDFHADKPQPGTSAGKRPRSPEAELEQKSSKMRALNPSVYSTSGFHSSKPTRAPIVVEKKVSRFRPRSANSRDEESVTSLEVDKYTTPHIPKDALYMFETLSKQNRVLTLWCQTLGNKLCELWESKNDSQVPFLRNVRSATQAKYRTFGRILVIQCPKTNAKTAILIGTKRMKQEQSAGTVTLDLKRVKEYSIFSGQMVAVEGYMNNNDVIIVQEIFCHGYATLPKCPALTKPLRVYVAAGPYTSYHSPDYQPLWNLLDCVKKEVPDILILIGPMVETKHSGFPKHYEFIYQEVFDRTVTRVIKELEGTPTKLVLIPSHRDGHHEPVYPTIEYILPEANKLNSSTSFSSLPDPCIMTVEDLLVGVTAVDVIKDLSHSEISNMTHKNRLGRLADHVLSQCTFYPVYPTPRQSVNIDISNWRKYASIETQPHVLVLPSDITQFSKLINGCLVLNPGRLFKGIFAKLEVPAAPAGGVWSGDSIVCEIEKFL